MTEIAAEDGYRSPTDDAQKIRDASGLNVSFQDSLMLPPDTEFSRTASFSRPKEYRSISDLQSSYTAIESEFLSAGDDLTHLSKRLIDSSFEPVHGNISADLDLDLPTTSRRHLIKNLLLNQPEFLSETEDNENEFFFDTDLEMMGEELENMGLPIGLTSEVLLNRGDMGSKKEYEKLAKRKKRQFGKLGISKAGQEDHLKVDSVDENGVNQTNSTKEKISDRQESEDEAETVIWWEKKLPKKMELLEDTTGAMRYQLTCAEMEMVPCRHFSENIESSQMILHHHGLGPKGTRALALALQLNISISHLDLSGNGIGDEGGEAIGKLLLENTFINSLILKNNNMKGSGVALICKAVQTASVVQQLDLSNNLMNESGLTAVCELIECSKSLVSLNVSRIGLSEDVADALGQALALNDVLERVDLSWNCLRGPRTSLVIRGLKENVRLKQVDLSYNGLDNQLGVEVSLLIKENGTIQDLNLQGNHIADFACHFIGDAIKTNVQESGLLTRLDLGRNPISTEGISYLLEPLIKLESIPLTYLGLEEIPSTFGSLQTIELLQSINPNLDCSHGPYLLTSNSIENKETVRKQARNLYRFMKHDPAAKILINKLKQITEDGSNTVPFEVFYRSIHELNLPFLKNNITDFQMKLGQVAGGDINFEWVFCPVPLNALFSRSFVMEKETGEC
ncbi:hypothetical protein Ciccas_004152 [Cichlidogyrus casuarinus]|uniref:Uncharacterized protein n=1 Tax=Cichlidogyrus casuarinus TaxID=1844966 RepID=A0ABD2QCB8_9PLAT